MDRDQVFLHPGVENESPRIRFQIMGITAPMAGPSLELKEKFGIRLQDTFVRKPHCQHELASATCWKKGVGDQYMVGASVSEGASEGLGPKDSESNHT